MLVRGSGGVWAACSVAGVRAASRSRRRVVPRNLRRWQQFEKKSIQADVALGADVSATSSSAQHVIKNAVDGDAHSFWASGPDPTSGVDLHIDLGATKQIRAVEIDWEYPAQACSTNSFVHIRWKILAYV